MIFLIIILTVLVTFLGGIFALKFSDKLHLILGFSAGTIIGITFFDLIPEAAELTQSMEKVSMAIVAGFVIYMIIERYFDVHNCKENCEKPSHKGEVGATALIIHSIIDGLVIGLSFQVSDTIGWLVSVAVLAHKFSDGINTTSVLLADKFNKSKIYRWLILASLAPIFGLALSWLISPDANQLGLLVGFFAGLFIYLGASDLIPESHHKHPAAWTTIATILGIIFIYLLTEMLHGLG